MIRTKILFVSAQHIRQVLHVCRHITIDVKVVLVTSGRFRANFPRFLGDLPAPSQGANVNIHIYGNKFTRPVRSVFSAG
jgi:hypothetical protein